MNGEPRFCAVIPSYNHTNRIAGVIAAARRQQLPVFVIDDGNTGPQRAQLAALHDPAAGVTVHQLDYNQGKGAAVLAGFALAGAAGFTHVVQIDADGQHDMAALPSLLALARQEPRALVTGLPQYDHTIPRGRAIGRWITHIWVWIETLSLEISDSMCGFRVYPLAAVQALLDRGEHIGRRMDFDTEIMVRLFWSGTPVRNVPVKVIYPPDNTSNFDLLRDNLRITAMHTRLALTMLLRLPALLARHWRGARNETQVHWAALPERGVLLGMRFSAMVLRLLGPKFAGPLLNLVALYFYLTASERRQMAKEYLARVFAAAGQARQPGFADGYRLFRNFAQRGLDVFSGWAGQGPAVEQGDLRDLLATGDKPRGAVIVVAHVGNVEVARSALPSALRRRLLVLVHTRHAENFNRLLSEFNPEAALNTLQVSEISPDTALQLAEHVESGGWVLIAGDRVPLSGQRVSWVPFLGHAAAFPQGPFILGALLRCPVHALFCRKLDAGYRLNAVTLAEEVVLPRGARQQALDMYVRRFVALLEQEVIATPYQWYNFFDFWADTNGSRPCSPPK